MAYWYQTMPGKPLPPLPSVEERIPRPVIKPAEMHKWRDAWRNAKGGGALWGS